MAVKTFTDNTSLPASDINTYLNNGGLVYVKSQTIGTAVASVTVSDAFSATYDNYLILMAGNSSTADDNGRMTLGSASTGYYGNLLYATPGSPSSFQGASDNNGGNFGYVWRSYAGGNVNIFVGTPFLTRPTTVTGTWITAAANGQYNGVLTGTTSYTSFTLTCAAGTLTGGTITVYGYRKA
jgi:hypothetical protein